MPRKDKERQKEYMKQYREDNKEKIKEYHDNYYRNNKDKFKQYVKNNPESKKESDKKYSSSDKGLKVGRISKWKERGVLSDDFDALHEIYIGTSNCELCDVELTEGKRTSATRCLDHDHTTGEVRNILCNSCNAKRR